MFNSKKTQLFNTDDRKQTSGNTFVKGGMKKSAETLSGNYALKYSETDNPFVTQFGSMSAYKAQRSYEEISRDTSTLWAINPRLTVCFIFFIRMITRITSLFDKVKTSTVQRGAGLRHEGIMRMLWLHVNHPETFWKNITLWISIGSWKDIIQMLSYDLQYNGWENKALDWNNMGAIIMAGLENPNTVNLVKKYLPQIKPNSKCTTVEAQADNMIAKWICSLLYGVKPDHVSKAKFYGHTYKLYRKLKASGTAHRWQQLISRGNHNLVDFDTVHGRALALMVSSKYLKNQGLEEKYNQWIESKPVAKFTGYVHELFMKIPTKPYQISTLNKQFEGLVEIAKKNAKTDTSLIVVRDTSGSMDRSAEGVNMSCGNIAKALALFFSRMLPDGHFANSWIEFNADAKMHQWRGSTPYENWINDHSSYIGNTDFQSVIRLFAKIKNSGVPESEFPTGILCISDGEFDPADLEATNVQKALHTLRSNGFSKEYVDNFKIVLWDLRNNYYGRRSTSFETYESDVPNVYYFSGFDGSTVAFLTGVEGQQKEPKTAKELFEAAMNQEVLNMIEI